MTDNLVSAKVDVWGITANESDINRQDICLWSVNLNSSDFKDLQVNSVYNTLILKADFKCLLGNYRMKSGSYGLRLRLVQKATNDNAYPIVQEVELDSSSMFGNPYSFVVYSTQEATFDISNIGTIDAISLYLYQDNNFTYYKDNGIIDNVPEADFDNILVKNIYLSFGSDLTKVEDNTLQIFTGDSAIYNGSENSSNSREIGLLWYNKDEDNTYIGFSDGIYDPDYDEIQYLIDTEEDSRLVSQLGKDVPTDKAGLTISADLEEVLPLLKVLRDTITRDLNNNIRSFEEQIKTISQATDLDNQFINVLNLISSTGKSITDNREKLKEEYTAILSAARKIQDGTLVPHPGQSVKFTTFESIVKNLLHFVNTLMSNTNTIIKNDYSGYISVYDTYKTRIDKVVDSISKQLKNIEFLISDDASVMNNFFTQNYTFIPYIKEDLSGYANKYCIYWYRYQPGYYDVEERFMEKGWRRLEDKNLGIPKEKLSEDSIYNAKKTLSDSVLVIELNTEMIEEKFAAVLFYNHTMYKSNVITFINENPPVDEKTADLANGACHIEHGENSQPSYQLYGLNNLILNVADVSYKRKLLLRYEGLNSGDEALYGAQIFWYMPISTTMLSYDIKDFTEEWSNDGGTAVGAYSKEGFICFYRTIGGTDIKDPETGDHIRYEINDADRYFTYRIKDYYSQTFTRNTIECKIILMDGTELKADISFVFSSFGTSGTDYTLVISPRTAKPAADYNAEVNVNLPLGIALYDYNNERLKIYETAAQVGIEDFVPYLSSLRWIGPTAYNALFTYIEGEERFGVENIDISVRGDKGPKDNFYPGILEVTVPYMIEEVDKEVDLITVYPIPFRAGNYYIEGASVVIYQSDGTNPSYYKNPFKIFNMDTNDEITDVTWSIVCYDENDKQIDWNLKNDPILEGFMPKLDSQNRLVPCNIYLEDNADGNNREAYPVVLCTKNGGSILWAQPIYCMKNRYASAMINKWDGSLVIDKENGTIMSTMLGAGRKNSANQFEGILMGDVGSASEDNATGVGLYGFHKGAQSFNFSVDGTAFIGKSGRGRIKFNGNSGTITSASYEQTKESAGMKIDLDDGIIDMRGARFDTVANEYTADTSSNIHIDVKSPYFKITSVNGNPLMFIGSEDEGYYLRTDNYEPTIFNFNEKMSNSQGTGMKIDLKDGKIDAYDFTLASKNIYLNSGEDATEYLVIKDNDNNMIFYAGSDDYYLKSVDYTKATRLEPGAGTLINLKEGKIDSYNFTLTSSRVTLSTESPYFEIVGDDTTLIHISEAYQYLRSNNYSVTNETGMEINLGTGELTAFDFSLKAGTSNGYIRMNTRAYATGYPLWLGTSENGANFKVDWAGNLYCNGMNAENANLSGTLNVGESLTVQGTLTGGTINGAEITGGSIDINGKFTVNSDGRMVCTSANIGGWEVQDTSTGGFTYPAGNFSVTPTGLNFNDMLTVGANGQTTIKDLIVTDSATFQNDCKVQILGQVGINAEPFSDYDLYTNGKSMLLGNVGIGIGAKDDYALSVSGSVYSNTDFVVTGGHSFTVDNGIGAVKFNTNGVWISGTNINITADEQLWLQGSVKGILNGTWQLQNGTLTVAEGGLINIANGNYFTIGNQTLLEYIKANASLLPFASKEDIQTAYNNGYSAGESAGYNRGYNAGDSAGYNRGYNAGYREGYNDGVDDATS